MFFPTTEMPFVIEIVSLKKLRLTSDVDSAAAGLVLAGAIPGPRLVDVNGKASADAVSCAGSFCRSPPLKRKNREVDFVQLPFKMGNQWVEVDLVWHGAFTATRRYGTRRDSAHVNCTLPSKARKVYTVEPAICIGRSSTLMIRAAYGPAPGRQNVRNWR
jgi:hypothetical protein